MAAQTLADEEYGKVNAGVNVTVDNSKVADLAEVTASNINTITVGTTAADKTVTNAAIVTKVIYTNKGKWCTYTNADGKSGTYNVTTTKPADAAN